MKILVVLFLLISQLSYAGLLYQCKENGRMAFQDKPCRGDTIKVSKPIENFNDNRPELLFVRPVKQFPMLCGPAVGEMIFHSYGINRVGKNEEYLISTGSRGAALGQYLCDLLDSGEITNNQPKCVDAEGKKIVVFQYDRPSSKKAARNAFKKGTWLSSLKVVFEKHGLVTKQVKSVKKYNGKYRSELVKNNFEGLIEELEKSMFVIFHVGYGDGVVGHYLLANGYDKDKGLIHYVNPWSTKDFPERASVSFSDMREGKPWFSKGRFWTGRYMSVGKAHSL